MEGGRKGGREEGRKSERKAASLYNVVVFNWNRNPDALFYVFLDTRSETGGWERGDRHHEGGI
jgi:hypothetical protein